ncbi:MAG: NCS2 family permease, partial [Clostridiales bacterium]|nr:NCS2 family permease [Clostridiales bacterium]
ISVGIGLFIAFIGLSNAGVIIQGNGVPLALGDVMSGGALLALIGLLLTSILLVKKIKGALLIGIVLTTIVGIPMGITSLPANIFQAPPSMAPIFFKFQFDQVFSLDMLVVLFTFLFVDMFDTVGTLIGVSTKAGMLDKDGKIPNVKKALMADAIGTTFGAIFGTSTVTTYVESASGVSEGGRSGFTAVVTAGMFTIALFLSPLFIMIPGAATAPALILVGLFMMSPIKDINFEDYSESIPAFVTLLFMPLTYSISEGIVFGIVSYVLIKLFSGKSKDISIATYVVAAVFILKFFV